MRHGSLFSGIGGFDLASEWMGWENIFQVEWDKYCQKVLEKNFPKVNRYGDIKKFKGIEGSVDIISGGFPCQPFSQAGKRKGTEDDRYLWPEMLRVIREVKPTFVVGENVAGLLSMEEGKTLEIILDDLENEGYEIESFIIPAASIGAWHRRERIWICGYSNSDTNRETVGAGLREKEKKEAGIGQVNSASGNPGRTTNRFEIRKNASNTNRQRSQGYRGFKECKEKWASWSGSEALQEIWEFEPSVGRVASRIPRRVDRLKGLGNAIVPQVAYEIFKAIENIK